MLKIFKIVTLSSALALILSGCNLTESVKDQSSEAQAKKPAPIYTPKSEETEDKASKTTSDTKEQSQKQKKAAPELLSLDDKGNVVSTVVTEDDSAEQDDLSDQGSKSDNDFIEQEEQSLRPQSAATSLPNYASGSDFANASCDLSLNASARVAAVNLAKNLSSRINVEPGQIYVAPSVIPDKYLDCIEDTAKSVATGLANAPSFNSIITQHDKMQVSSQNIGSSRLIPMLVRQCRSNDIPYLAITIVKDIGTTPTLTLRLIRVETGITLSQAYEKLK